MRILRLREHATSPGEALSAAEAAALRRFLPSVQVQPSAGLPGHYDLRPGSRVGLAQVGDLAIEIRPKLPIQRVLFLLSYVAERHWWTDEDMPLEPDVDLLEAIIPGFALQVRRALRRGLLQGYQTREEALPLVRGRIRFDDQIRRHHGRLPPIEVRYDAFTADIEANRLLKAANNRLRRLPLRHARSRRSLAELDSALSAVSDVRYHPRHLPELSYNRLNAHYRPAVELARLILRDTSFDLSYGATSAAACLIDMNRVFEDFVVLALREALGLGERSFPQGAAGRSLWLDRDRRAGLRPDLSWWEGDQPVFVGDVKYKKVVATGILHPDLYQALAYAVATDLPGALLIYAAGESEPALHRIAHADKTIEVLSMDLAGPPSALRADVERIAARVRRWRAVAGSRQISPRNTLASDPRHLQRSP